MEDTGIDLTQPNENVRPFLCHVGCYFDIDGIKGIEDLDILFEAVAVSA